MPITTQLEIQSYRGISELFFGMTPDQVRATLGDNFQSYQKTPTSEMPTDAFDPLGIHVFYKAPGHCEAIELFAPAEPMLQGIPLIGQPFSVARDRIQALDSDVEVDESGLISQKLGIGLYAPFAADASEEPVESVIVFERGYYDR
jgi:hypothetical protein